MANLSTKIKLYCEANGVSNVDFTKDVMLQDDSDGNGARIVHWGLSISQPTDAQLSEHETSANTEEAKNVVRNTRRTAYPEIGDQLDMLWHTMDGDNELQHKFYDFYQTIKKVKVAYPKK